MLSFKASLQLEVVWCDVIGYPWVFLCACGEDRESWALASVPKTFLSFTSNGRSWENEYSEFLNMWTSAHSCVDVSVRWVGTVGPQHGYNAQAPRSRALGSFVRTVLQWPSRSLWPCCSCAGLAAEV